MSLLTAATTPDEPSAYRTVSMAVPGSIIDNAQNSMLATFMAGQIARTAAVFNVDEVVVFDDTQHAADGTVSSGTAFLARMLLFMETPQYLRKALIPMHPDLRTAGVLPPLDAPHHLRSTEWAKFREGVVLRNAGQGSCVDIGLEHAAYIPEVVQPNTRVTLAVGSKQTLQFVPAFSEDLIMAQVASPQDPRLKAGLYWGYSTRIAQSLSLVFSECPYDMGYDLKLGTSEHGVDVMERRGDLKFNHLLIAFGGLNGLEECMQNDWLLHAKQPKQVFDMYINTCPGQGSRTIRTEEAVLISMACIKVACCEG